MTIEQAIRILDPATTAEALGDWTLPAGAFQGSEGGPC